MQEVAVHGKPGIGRAAVLLVGLSAVLVLVGALLGWAGLVVALLAVAALHWYAWSASGTVTLRAMRAYPVSEAQQPEMFAIVRDLCRSSRQPMPRLYVSPTAAPNALAIGSVGTGGSVPGRRRNGAAICCTEGLLATLTGRELRAVLAHELAHAQHRDAVVATVATALAAAVLFAAQLSWVFSGGEDDDDGGGVVGFLLLLVLGPVAAGILRMAVSRAREHRADAAAATLTGDPLGLAGALRTLDGATRVAPLRAEPALRAVSALMIVDPFRPDFFGGLFRTHPPTVERINRLESLAGYRR